jgi:hypothetical protein
VATARARPRLDRMARQMIASSATQLRHICDQLMTVERQTPEAMDVQWASPAGRPGSSADARQLSRTISALMLVAAVTLLAASAIHFGLSLPLGPVTLHDPFAGAAIPEAVLGVVLTVGAGFVLSGWSGETDCGARDRAVHPRGDPVRSEHHRLRWANGRRGLPSRPLEHAGDPGRALALTRRKARPSRMSRVA